MVSIKLNQTCSPESVQSTCTMRCRSLRTSQVLSRRFLCSLLECLVTNMMRCCYKAWERGAILCPTKTLIIKVGESYSILLSKGQNIVAVTYNHLMDANATTVHVVEKKMALLILIQGNLVKEMPWTLHLT